MIMKRGECRTLREKVVISWVSRPFRHKKRHLRRDRGKILMALHSYGGGFGPIEEKGGDNNSLANASLNITHMHCRERGRLSLGGGEYIAWAKRRHPHL